MTSLPPILDIDKQHIVEHCGELAPFLSDQQLLITGGTGFFGAWLLEGLAAIREAKHLSFTITVLTRDLNAFKTKLPHLANLPYLNAVIGDVKKVSVSNFADSIAFDSIIHAATETRVTNSFEASIARLETIIEGTRNVLEVAQATGVTRLLNISSGAVYGKQPRTLTHIPETFLQGPDPLDKDASYGEAKRIAEHLCVLYASNSSKISIPTARCFAFHGAHLPLDQHFAAGNVLNDVMNHHQIKITGDGTPRRSYLYGADLVIWLLHVLYRGDSGVAYNVGSDADMSIAELAERTALALGQPPNLLIMKEPDPAQVPERYVPDVSKCRNSLGLKVRIPFEEQVRRTAQWHGLRRNLINRAYIASRSRPF